MVAEKACGDEAGADQDDRAGVHPYQRARSAVITHRKSGEKRGRQHHDGPPVCEPLGAPEPSNPQAFAWLSFARAHRDYKASPAAHNRASFP
jgi:hypothetical protein